MGVFALPENSSLNPNADKRPALYATSGVFLVLTSIAVALRFLSRRLAKIPLKLDDWLILVALPFAFACNGVDIFGAKHNGQGQHINHSTPESLKRFFQATYVFLICYNFAIALAKYSLILFYRRIFSTTGFKLPLLITGLLTTGWLIGCTFASIFGCSPVQGYWEINKPSKCIDERAFYTGQTASNMFLDVTLMVIPIFAISRLQMSRAHKIAVAGIFALGIFVTVCSAVRLAELIKIQREEEFDFTFDIVEAACWSVIECNVSIICACLPTLRPLLRFVLTGSAHPRSSSRQPHSNRVINSRGNVISGPFTPLESSRNKSLAQKLAWDDQGYSAEVYAGGMRSDGQNGGSAEHGNARDYEMDQRRPEGSEDIKVNTNITWFESRRASTTETESMEALKKDIEVPH